MKLERIISRCISIKFEGTVITATTLLILSPPIYFIIKSEICLKNSSNKLVCVKVSPSKIKVVGVPIVVLKLCIISVQAKGI